MLVEVLPLVPVSYWLTPRFISTPFTLLAKNELSEDDRKLKRELVAKLEPTDFALGPAYRPVKRRFIACCIR